MLLATNARPSDAGGDTALRPRTRLTAPAALAVLVAVAVLIRVGLAAIYQPIVMGDATVYLQLARLLAEGRFHTSIGHVSPVYPCFLLVLGMNPPVVWLAQSLLGMGIAVLVFVIALRHTLSPGVALAVGLVQAISFDQLFYEPFLVTEVLGTFLTVAAWFFLAIMMLEARPTTWRWLGLSCALALAGLVRSLPLALVPLWGVFLFRPQAGRWTIDARHVAAFLIPLSVLVGGWSLDNWIHHDYFGPSTMTGYRLSQHAGAWMERAPDEYADIRDIYLRHRRAIVSETGTQFGTIWSAMREMQDSTGLDYAALSKRVNAVSLWLIRDQPLRYLASVCKAWMYFWTKSIGWKLNLIRPASLAPVVRLIGITQRVIGLGVNAMFLLLAAWLIAAKVLRRAPPVDGFTTLTILTVLVASFAQALVELSDNGRFGMPFQPFVQYVVIVWVTQRWWRNPRSLAATR